MRHFISKGKLMLILAGFFLSTTFSFGQLVSSPFGWCNNNGTVTGGGSASSVTVSSNSAFRSAVSGSSSKVVYVNGTIDLGVANYCSVGSNTTIIGVGSNAKLVHGGIYLNGVSNVIIRNIAFQDGRDPDWECETPTEGGQPSNCTSSNSDYDLCKMYGASRIWIDHCSFINNQTSYLAYDGTCDITGGCDLITISYCVFRNNHKGMSLIGGSDSDNGNYRITYAYNWIETDSRNPMVRHGKVHILNNYYSNVSDYCIGLRINCRVYAEGNYFYNCKKPSTLGTASGQIRNVGNTFSSCNPNSFEGQVSSVGWTPSYSYTALSSSEVPSHVQSNAGPGKSLGGSSSSSSSSSSSGSNGTVNGTYSIIASHSGKALDTYNWGTGNGTNICQWSYWGGAAQQFNISAVDGEWHRITPAISSGQAIDVEGVSTSDGANIFTWSYWGGHGQQFRFQSAGSGVWRIIARHSEKCIDIAGNSSADGANAIQWTCISGASNQMFQLVRVNSADVKSQESIVGVYPNPSSDGMFSLSLPADLTGNINIAIYDMQGKEMLNTMVEAQESVKFENNLNQGIYILKIRTESFEVNKKLMVK